MRIPTQTQMALQHLFSSLIVSVYTVHLVYNCITLLLLPPHAPSTSSRSSSRTCKPKPIQLSEITGLSVQFWFSPFRTPNRTVRTVLPGSGSGSENSPNRTDGPVRGPGKSSPEPDRTEPRQPY